MRILLINKYHYMRDGSTRAYFDTAHILREAGHEVAFFSMRHPQNEPTPWEQYFVDQVDYTDTEGPSLREKLRIVMRMIWNREAQRQLDRLIEEFQPEVAHLHNVYHQLSPAIIRTLHQHGIPMVMTLHDYKLVSPNYNLFVRGRIWEGSKPRRYWRCVADRCVRDSYLASFVCTVEAYLHRWFGTYGLVDHFIAPSHFLIDTFHDFGWERVIQHVPQPLRPFPQAEASPVSAPDAPYIFLGRLSPEKGVSVAIEAMHSYTGPSSLWIVGTGPEEARLREQASDLGERVKFWGHLSGDALRDTLSQAKALILPSVWYENMPYVMLEALGAGRPVIASRLGGIVERITDGVNGSLFEAGDAQSLVEQMSRLETTDSTALSRRAYASIADLTPEQYLTTLEQIYTGLVEANKKTASAE
jgi:glycosyltransferase involved in cell wall biosynthesis